jgi:hypothetical protein
VQRLVTAELDLDLGASVDLIFQIAAAQPAPVLREELTFTQGDRVHADRDHRPVRQPSAPSARRGRTPRGALRSAHRQVAQRATSDLEAITYLRPSRYCQSDEVFSQARRQFRGLQGLELITAVSEFVASSTTYTPGLSQGTDSAVTTS